MHHRCGAVDIGYCDKSLIATVLGSLHGGAAGFNTGKVEKLSNSQTASRARCLVVAQVISARLEIGCRGQHPEYGHIFLRNYIPDEL